MGSLSVLQKEYEQEVLKSSMNYESDKSSKNSRICVVLFKSLQNAPSGDGCQDEQDYHFHLDQSIWNFSATFQASLLPGW